MNQLAIKYRHQLIDLPEVRDEFELFSGLNEKIFDTDYTFADDEVRNSIASQLIGQEDAVKKLVECHSSDQSQARYTGQTDGVIFIHRPNRSWKNPGIKGTLRIPYRW